MRALTIIGAMVGVLLSSASSYAQGQVMYPQAGCTATPAQLEANKKVAMAFFVPNADRVSLADQSYKQHNPAFLKGGKEAGLSDYEYFKSRFGGPPRQGGPGPGRGVDAGPPAASRESARDRDGRMRSGDGHPQKQSPGSNRSIGHVLRGVHLRHLPRAERQAGRTLGRRGDQSACDRREAVARSLSLAVRGLAALACEARSARVRSYDAPTLPFFRTLIPDWLIPES